MRKVVKIIFYPLIGLVAVVLGVIIILLTPWGKNVLRGQIEKYLNKKLGTKVVIGGLDYHIPRTFELDGVLFLDQRQDTLLALNKLEINMDMLGLLKNSIKVNKLLIDGLNARIDRRRQDTTYNFQYIVNAFTGPDTASAAPPSKASTPWHYSVGLISITNSAFRYEDTAGGNFFGIRLGELSVDVSKTDLDSFHFDVNDLKLRNVQSYFRSDTVYYTSKQTDTSAPLDLRVNARHLFIENTGFRFTGNLDATGFMAQVNGINADNVYYGQLQEYVKASLFSVDGLTSSVTFGKLPKWKQRQLAREKEIKAGKDTSTSRWIVDVNKLMAKGLNFRMDDNNQAPLKKGMDYAHLDLRNFFLNADSAYYSPDTSRAIVQQLMLGEKSGLNIRQFKGRALYTARGVFLKDFLLQTPNTVLQSLIEARYPSLAILADHPEKMQFNVALRNSKIGLKDLELFLTPAQMRMLYSYTRNNIMLNMLAVSGNVNNINVLKANIRALHQTQADVSGHLYNAMNPDRMRYDFVIRNLKSSAQDLNPLLPATAKQNIALPAWFTVAGRIHGDMSHYYPNLRLRSSDGNANVSGMYVMGKKPTDALYDIKLDAQALNVGRILKMPDKVRIISANGSVKGSGLDIQHNMKASFNLNVSRAWIMGYDYHNISAIGNIAGQSGHVVMSAKDPNAMLHLVADADFHNEYPAVVATLNADYLDLHALGFTTDTLSFTGDLYADFESLNPDYPVGDLSMNRPFLTIPGQTFMLDSVSFSSHPDTGGQHMAANIGNIADVKLTGHIPVTQMGNALLAHINQYYRLTKDDPKAPLSYDMNLEGHINYHPLLRNLVPNLKPFDTISLSATLAPNNLQVTGFARKLNYNGMVMDTITLSGNEFDSVLSYAVSVNKFKSGSLQFNNTVVGGYIKNDSIFVGLQMADTAGNNQFTVNGGLYNYHGGNRMFQLLPGMVINYQPWDISLSNKVVLSNKGYYLDSLYLNHDSQLINVYSDTAGKDPYAAPLKVNIQNLVLSDFTKMFSGDTLIADGILNSKMDIDIHGNTPEISADVHIDSLAVMDAPIGTLDGKVANSDENTLNTSISLLGWQSGIRVNGNYYFRPVDSNEFNMTLNIDSFNLKAYEPLAFGSIRNSSGGLTGELQIRGTTDTPAISGQLTTDSLKTTVSMLNSPVLIPNQSITFIPKRGIQLQNFSIYDAHDRPLVINGNVMSRTMRNYFLRLGVTANHWLAMNSTAKNNPQMYGKLLLNANLNINGPATVPSIDGNLSILDSTDFHYNMLDNPELVSNAGIVEFYNSHEKYEVEDSADQKKPDLNKLRLSRNTSMNINVGIEKNAKFNVLIDPQTGDNLSVSGVANLNTTINSDGTIGLTGVYEINQGFYELNIKVLKRKFLIQPGSAITFAGDPYAATANLTALYSVNAAPYDLVSSLVSTEDLNYFRQQLPFDVLLNMKGKVMAPEISFDIQLPDSKSSSVATSVANQVQSALTNLRTNSSDLNKQVISLLLLNSFLPNDPFSVSGVSGANNMVQNTLTQSASSFLTSQLNSLAGRLVNGLTLNLNLNNTTDYSTGSGVSMTDLNVSASKRFLNNRLNVTVGSDFNLDGATENVDNQQSLLIPGNISFDYMLTPSGQYTLRGYRQTQLQNLLTGYVVETGVGFRMNFDYNRFKYLFMTNARRQRLRMQRLQEQQAADNASGSGNENKEK